VEDVTRDWQSDVVDIRSIIDIAAPPVGHNRDANHVPGVVITGVVVGILLLWAAVRGMFGKKK
jgi:hypothetical protein